MVTTQQEKLLGEKDIVLERQKHEMRVLNEALAQKQEDVSGLCLASFPGHSECGLGMWLGCAIQYVPNKGGVTS